MFATAYGSMSLLSAAALKHLEASRALKNDAPGRKHRRHVEHKEDTEDTFAMSQCATTSLPTTSKRRRTLRFLRVVQAPQVAEKPELQARARKTARGEDYTSKKMDFSLLFIFRFVKHLEASRALKNDAPGRKHRRHVEHKEDTEDTFAMSQCATTSLPTTSKRRRTLRFLRVVQAPQVAEKPELQARARKTARGEDYTSKKMDFSLLFIFRFVKHLEASRALKNDAPGRKHRRHVEHKEDTEDTFAMSQCATTSLPTTSKRRRTLRFLRVVQAPQVAEKPELQARARKTARGEDYTSKKMDFSLLFIFRFVKHLEASRALKNDAPGRKHRRHVEHKEDTEDTFAMSQCATTSLPTTSKRRRTLRFLRVVQAPQVAEKPELQARARKTARGEDYTSKKMDFSLLFIFRFVKHLEASRALKNDAPGRKHRRHVEHKEDTEDTFAMSQCATTSLPTTSKRRRTLRFLRVVQAPQVAEKPELQARARKTARGEDYTSKKMDFSLLFIFRFV
ncbi:hypothetical protein Bbelb_073190 [Branchiostoma belcheri]|nr:hypothetical protein Bbelb_073190 [Branchiostoma belcheri]